MLQQHDTYQAEPPNHSTLPKHQPFMRRVVAYDLPIGFCDAYEKRDFWISLMKQADWTRGRDPYFETGVLETVVHPVAIDWTSIASENDASIQALKKIVGRQFNYQGKDTIYGD